MTGQRAASMTADGESGNRLVALAPHGEKNRVRAKTRFTPRRSLRKRQKEASLNELLLAASAPRVISLD
jgi:hypothetical protein